MDRGHRELPIKLDYVGKNVPTQPDDDVRLQGGDGAEAAELTVVVLAGSGDGGRS